MDRNATLARFNIFAKRMAVNIADAIGAEVDICNSYHPNGLINVLVIDAKQSKRVAQFMRKTNRSLKIVEVIEYPATLPDETDSTLLIYGVA